MSKEKTFAANKTPDLFGLKKRGRPVTGAAMTTAERQAKYRNRQNGDTLEKTIKALAKEFEMPVVDVRRELIRFALCNNNWKLSGFPVRGQE